MFVKLTKEQLAKKKKFISNYINSSNAATGSQLDANANVSTKNIATLSAELNKDFNIQINRGLLEDKIESMFGRELADEYLRQLNNHEIYTHDESSIMPYCTSISMYPMLIDGMTKIGGTSIAPKHLESFIGIFHNLVFAVSSQFAGAVATVEFLTYMDYFARREYGDDYLETNKNDIEAHLQDVVHTLNQPAAARGYQCVREDTTQLSTPNGYKYLHELKEGDDCYVWKDGQLTIEPIKKLNVHDYNGNLVQFKGRNYQQTVTPNHRVLYKKPNTSEYGIKEAKDLVGKSKLSLPIGSNGVDREDYPISDNMLKMCVVALTDGSIDGLKDGDNFSGRLTIFKSKNRWGYKEIPEMLNEMGIGYTESDIDSNSFGEMVRFRLTNVDSQSILRTIKHTKKELPHFFKLLSSRQIDVVVDTWSKLDGSNNDEHTQLLQCDNDDIRDSLQEVVFLAGHGSECYDRVMTKFNSDDKAIVKYVKIFKRKDKRISEYNEVKYKGKVWCPTTDAGVVVFREENGIPYVSGNSVFWNISILDENYFKSLFENFFFPCGDTPKWETTNKLQKFFMKWFNEERTKSMLTFPVVTAACLTDDDKNDLSSDDFKEFLAEEMSEGNQFFKYMSNSVDSLSSCCRLKNEFSENTFSYSLGAGGIQTGSINVITINVNRLVQDNRDIKEEVEKVHKYQVAYRALMEDFLKANMLTVYDAGFITMSKQFSTIGINGFVEAAEYKGIKVNANEDYFKFTKSILKEIYDANRKAAKEYGCKFNTEFVPAENLGVKFAAWDKADGYFVPRDCYNSYFYIVEDEDISILDKIKLHGKTNTRYLDGGSALHLNLDQLPSGPQAEQLLKICADEGCDYIGEQVKGAICDSCGSYFKETHINCPKCGKEITDYATRVIGYLKRISSFSEARQKEAGKRRYHMEKK